MRIGVDTDINNNNNQEEDDNNNMSYDTETIRLTQPNDMRRDIEEAEYHPITHLRQTQIASGPPKKILPREERYPFCIVWSPLGPITTCFPFVGHMGICDSRGYIWDFQGPYSIGRDNMAFGNPTRILQLNPNLCKARRKEQTPAEFWDECLYESNCMYSRRMHNICCDN